MRVVAHQTVDRIKPEEQRLIVELREGEPLGPFLATLHDVRHFELTEEADRRVVQLELDEVNEEVVAGSPTCRA